MIGTYTIDQELLRKVASDAALSELESEGKRTIRLNHPDCPAGIDTRMRLYVTLTEEGTILGYCHNCSGKGFVRNHTGHRLYTSADQETNDRPLVDSRVEDVLRKVFKNTMYVMKDSELLSPWSDYVDVYQLSLDVLTYDDWCVAEDEDRRPCFLWPVTNNGHWQGFQARFLDGKQPKVLTYGTVKGLHIINPNDSPIAVICEDRTSGCRIAQAGYAAVVLHGSRVIKVPEAHQLSLLFDRFIVWYDNDNEVVCKNATATHHSLTVFSPHSYVEISSRDPKHYTHELIQETVGRYA